MNDSGTAPTVPSRTVQEKYEAGRMDNLRFGYPILQNSDAFTNAVTWLDRVSPEELSDAVDEIIMVHAARLAIKSVARVDAAMATRHKHGFDGIPADALVRELSAERDKAVDFYQQIRERKARIARLEALADKTHVIAFPKKLKTHRARLRKADTA